MRVMVIVKATKDSEAGGMPSTEMMAAMGLYNEKLVNAGIMVSGDGLKPSSKGKRIHFDGTKRSVSDGPFMGRTAVSSRGSRPCRWAGVPPPP